MLDILFYMAQPANNYVTPVITRAQAAKDSMDTHTILEKFNISTTKDPNLWFAKFENFAKLKKWDNADTPKFLPLFLSDAAHRWYNTLPDASKNTTDALRTAFLQQYLPHESIKWTRLQEFEGRKQQQHETIEEYAADLSHMAQLLSKDDDALRDQFILNCRPSIKSFLLLRNPTTYAEAYKLARQASALPQEATAFVSPVEAHSGIAQELSRIREYQQDLQSQVAAITGKLNRSVHFHDQQRIPQQSRSPTPPPAPGRSREMPYRQTNPTRASPAVSQREYFPRTPTSRNHMRPKPSYQRHGRDAPINTFNRSAQQYATCSRCGTKHQGRTCLAQGKICAYCKRPNHFAKVCRMARTNNY